MNKRLGDDVRNGAYKKSRRDVRPQTPIFLNMGVILLQPFIARATASGGSSPSRQIENGTPVTLFCLIDLTHRIAVLDGALIIVQAENTIEIGGGIIA